MSFKAKLICVLPRTIRGSFSTDVMGPAKLRAPMRARAPTAQRFVFMEAPASSCGNHI